MHPSALVRFDYAGFNFAAMAGFGSPKRGWLWCVLADGEKQILAATFAFRFKEAARCGFEIPQ
jgi:hypothetical protein